MEKPRDAHFHPLMLTPVLLAARGSVAKEQDISLGNDHQLYSSCVQKNRLGTVSKQQALVPTELTPLYVL